MKPNPPWLPRHKGQWNTHWSYHQGQCNMSPILWNSCKKTEHSLCHLKLRGNDGNKTQQSTTGMRMSRSATCTQAMPMMGKDEIIINMKRERMVRVGTNTRATMVSLPAHYNRPCLAQTMPSSRACTTFDQTLFVYALVWPSTSFVLRLCICAASVAKGLAVYED